MVLPFDPLWLLLVPVPFWVALVWWNLRCGFCGYLEEKIAQGKSWLYVPLSWRENRAARKVVHKVLHCLTAAVTAATVWYVFFPGRTVLLPFSLLAFSLLAWGVKKQLQRRRYSQQATLYFDRLRDHFDLAERSAKRVTEAEVKNLVSWEHQQLLLRADQHKVLFLLLAGKRKASEFEEEGRQDG